MAAVNVETQLQFQKELLDGLYSADSAGTLEPMAEAVRAWYRSAQFLSHPDFSSRLQQSKDDVASLLGHER